MSNGTKHDGGKPRPSLVLGTMARAIRAVVDVAEHGAQKYSADNWLQVPDGQHRYTDAMLRHLVAEQTGEAKDPDSGLLHAAHAAWGALARLDLMLRKAEQVKVPPASTQAASDHTADALRYAFSPPVYEIKYDWERSFKGFGHDAAAIDALRTAADKRDAMRALDAAGLLNTSFRRAANAVGSARLDDLLRQPVPRISVPPLLNWPQQLVKWLRHYSKAFGPLADRGLLIAQYCTNTCDMRVIGSKAGRYSGLLAMVNAVPQDNSAADVMAALGLAVDESVKHWDGLHAAGAFGKNPTGVVIDELTLDWPARYASWRADASKKAEAERQAKRAAEAAKRRDEREKLNAEIARQQRLLQTPNRVAMAALKHQLAQNKLAKPLERLRRAGRLVAEVKEDALWLKVLDPAKAPLLIVGQTIDGWTSHEEAQKAIRAAVFGAYRRLVTMPGLERYIVPRSYGRR